MAMKIFRRTARSRRQQQDNNSGIAAPTRPAIPEIITPSVVTSSTAGDATFASHVNTPPHTTMTSPTPCRRSDPPNDPSDSKNNKNKNSSGQETKETVKKQKKKKSSKKSTGDKKRQRESPESSSSPRNRANRLLPSPPVQVVPQQPTLAVTVRELHQEGILVDMTKNLAVNASRRFGEKAAKALGSSIKKSQDVGRSFGSDASFILGFVWLLTTCINADVCFASTVVYVMMYAGFCIWLLDATTAARRRDKKKSSRRRNRDGEDRRRNEH